MVQYCTKILFHRLPSFPTHSASSCKTRTHASATSSFSRVPVATFVAWDVDGATGVARSTRSCRGIDLDRQLNRRAVALGPLPAKTPTAVLPADDPRFPALERRYPVGDNVVNASRARTEQRPADEIKKPQMLSTNAMNEVELERLALLARTLQLEISVEERNRVIRPRVLTRKSKPRKLRVHRGLDLSAKPIPVLLRASTDRADSEPLGPRVVTGVLLRHCPPSRHLKSL